jgi:beta-galactosidase
MPAGFEPAIELPALELKQMLPLERAWAAPVQGPRPLTLEALGASYGYVLYRHAMAAPASGRLELVAHDYALIRQNGQLLGVLDRRRNETTLEVKLAAGAALEIVVEALGRVNFGPGLVNDRKGIIGPVRLDGQELTGWEMRVYDVAQVPREGYGPGPATGPAFYRAGFELASTGDTFVDLSGWGKGYVWVNGHNLGRYWSAGPQQTLWCPGVWLRKRDNEIVVLDLEVHAARMLRGVKDPIWATPER